MNEYEDEAVWYTVRRATGMPHHGMLTLERARRIAADSDRYFVAHWDAGTRQWVEAPESPEPRSPWMVVDEYGFGSLTFATRSEAEADSYPGGRIMKLVDVDAQVVKLTAEQAAWMASVLGWSVPTSESQVDAYEQILRLAGGDDE